MNVLSSLSASLLVLSSALLVAQEPAYTVNPKFIKEVAAAKDNQQPAEEQLGHWKKANKIAGGACLACLRQITLREYRGGDTKATIESATALESVATAPSDKAFAAFLRGTARFHSNHEKPKPEALDLALTDFQAAFKSDPKLHEAALLEGRTLALLHRDDQARLRFLAYVKEASASDRYRLRAQHFAENPALARATMAPPFTVKTAGGKEFTLDDMGGRVVLVDFWATWCGPCNEELPHIKKLAQEFAGQPFVLISVSWDKDAGKWQEFIEKHGMTWNQYRDAGHQLSTDYGVESIPHYSPSIPMAFCSQRRSVQARISRTGSRSLWPARKPLHRLLFILRIRSRRNFLQPEANKLLGSGALRCVIGRQPEVLAASPTSALHLPPFPGALAS